MLDKLEAIKERFEEVGQLIVQPDAMSDMKRYSRLSKEYKDLDKIVSKYHEYRSTLDSIEEAREILDTEKDPEFREMAKAELEECKRHAGFYRHYTWNRFWSRYCFQWEISGRIRWFCRGVGPC